MNTLVHGSERLIEGILPAWDIRERHEILVNAPVRHTFDAALRVRMADSPLVRSLLYIRTLPARLRGRAGRPVPEVGLMEETAGLGWREIGSIPGRQLVMGAVTRPWQGVVTFRGMPADEFAAFDEPGFVRIAWSLEAVELEPQVSIFITETRAAASSEEARRRFRRYWRLVAPGVILIRRSLIRLVRRDAERRWKYSRPVR